MSKKVRRNNRSVRKTRKSRHTRRRKRVKKQYGGVDSEEANSPPPSDKLNPSLVPNPLPVFSGTGEDFLKKAEEAEAADVASAPNPTTINISDLLKISPGQPTLSLAATPFTTPLPPAASVPAAATAPPTAPAASAPPPYQLPVVPGTSRPEKPLPIAYTRHEDGDLYRTPSNKIRSMYPVIGGYLERPTKLPVTDEIKGKEVKLIDAHGTIITDNWFLIPEGVKIITFSTMGTCVSGPLDKSHLEPILELYLSGGSLFKDDDEKEKEKTKEFYETVTSFHNREIEGGGNYKYDYKLHKENTIFPETKIFFDGPGSGCGKNDVDVNCAIVSFNKLTCRSLTDTEKLKDEIVHFIPNSINQDVKLSKLIKELGKGTYILFTCRSYDKSMFTDKKPFTERFLRDIESGRHMNDHGKIKEKEHNVITFKITVNEDAAKKESIEKFFFLVLGENNMAKIRNQPLVIVKLFRDIYLDVNPDDDITPFVSLTCLIRKYKDLYTNTDDIMLLNKTLFSLLKEGEGLILDEIGDEMLDTTEIDWPQTDEKVPAFARHLLWGYLKLKDT